VWLPPGRLAGLDTRPYVSLLGPVKAHVKGRETGVSGVKPRLLLVLLALSAGRAVSVDSLIDRVWGDRPPATARKALQVHISTLRRLLGEEAIATETAGYRLEADVDSIQFESIIEDAARAPNGQLEHVAATLEQALAMWRDVPFADLPDEPALVPERVRLTELRLGAIERRLETLIDMGRHQEVLGDLERLTADNPYREELRRLQMLALYRSGRQAEALKAFQATRHRLVEDLGIDPSTELQELEQRILEHDPGLGPPERRPPAYVALPMRRSDLVGRESDIESVMELMAGSSLVTLTGVGGCGKTRLAIEIAHQIAPEYPDGAYFVDLTRISDDDAVASAAIGAIGLEIRSASETGELISFLRPRKALLVLDNCEHVLNGVADVVDVLLEQCPELTVLATSREAISVSGEIPWRVPSLDASGSDSSAVRLFINRAQEADGSFQIHDDEVPQVIEICERLDGIPLAIELAAARTKTMTVSEVRQRLDDRFRLLAGGRRRASQRQQTLQGAVEWSYGLLTDAEKAILRRLAVFQGGFDLVDVPAVTGFDPADALDVVDSLVSKSLVDVLWVEGSISRRRLLETIRHFALDRLIAEDDAEVARERHYELFAGELRGKLAWEVEINAELRERCDRELDNFIAAIDWARDTGREEEAALTAARISVQLFWAGLLPKYRDLLRGEYELEPQDEATLLMGQASLLHSTDEPAEAAKDLSRRAREIESDYLIPDLVIAQVTEFDFAPVEGAAERLAVLDEMLADTDPSAPDVYLAEIEIRRAGQLVSLARLDEALEASRRALDWALPEGVTSAYWDATATIALLVLQDRRDEAEDVVGMVRREADKGSLTGFAPVVEILTALSRVGGGDPRSAGKDLAESALEFQARRLPLQEGDYLALFAAFRAELGDRERAEELLEVAPVKNGHINWLVWPYVWKWDPEEFEQLNTERRLWELDKMGRASEAGARVPLYLTEEINAFSGLVTRPRM
jgi:predicted ATPase/DNA-binding SARP family transcriptional activator